MTSNQAAEAALEAAVRSTVGIPKPLRIHVKARDNHSGEPSFYVLVEMPKESDIPSLPVEQSVTRAMLAALDRLDDERFPYLSFSAGDMPRVGGPAGEDDDPDQLSSAQ